MHVYKMLICMCIKELVCFLALVFIHLFQNDYILRVQTDMGVGEAFINQYRVGETSKESEASGWDGCVCPTLCEARGFVKPFWLHCW